LTFPLKPIELTSYWRTIRVPGAVTERPGQSDVGVTTPLAGVVQHVAAVPGDPVRPGDELFTLKLISESLQTSQTELYKTVRDLAINQDQTKRLEKLAKQGAIPEARLIELEQQQQRLTATREAYGQDLKARGLSPEQIKSVEEGRFVTEITVRAPAKDAGRKSGRVNLVPVSSRQPVDTAAPLGEGEGYEVEELKVNLGEHVQAGQALAILANHGVLYVEGRGFKQEMQLLTRTAEEAWPVRAEFTEEAEKGWPPFSGELKIQFLAATIDPASQTFAFYLSLPNQSREYQRGDKTYRVWRFRPGQRVRLQVAVEQLQDVFVLPAAAVVREGPEAYVFRANGDALDRKPVHVLLEDQGNVIVANDGSVAAGNYLAQIGAAQLNRVLKAKAAGGEGHAGHDHAGHSHEH
jgi:cobalt-zinc-cadmium efflux system membrane fusion protein